MLFAYFFLTVTLDNCVWRWRTCATCLYGLMKHKRLTTLMKLELKRLVSLI